MACERQHAKVSWADRWYCAWLVNVVVLAVSSAGVARPPTFQHEVRPIFEARCFGCHGLESPKGELDLRTFASTLKGGSGGPVVVPGNPDGSVLWRMIDSGRMPKRGEPLTAAEKRLVRSWIERGRFPTAGATLTNSATPITDDERQFWSFRKPVKPAEPAVQQKHRVRTPIDAFILRPLEDRGWTLGADADRTTLIRRVYLDLIGLPPPPERVAAFVADDANDAYDRLIESLLASPRYGERWGRHWLDVAGYSDSVGNAADEIRPLAWPYRDYVIRALNDDKPYDQFLLEQMAGDQLTNYEPGSKPTPEQADMLVATGFLRLAPDISDTQTIYQVDKWFDALFATVETSMKAVLGLQFACARCHDHKFDPISQVDYFRITAAYQAAMDPENWIPAALGFGQWPTRYVLDAEPARRQAYIKAALEDFPRLRRDRRSLQRMYEDRRRQWREQQTAKAALALAERSAATGGAEAGPDFEITNRQLELAFSELGQASADLRRREQAYEEVTPGRIWGLWDVSKTPSPTYLLIRGSYLAPGPPVAPGIPAVLDDPDRPFRFPAPRQEWHHTGRRLTLARWLTQPDHPLTARVLVNRVWQFHFGRGIVQTPDDFGTQGARPSHPELLDWLAVRFVENGWSLKWLHRQILRSSVYRQASAEDAEKLAVDPGNQWVWRKSPLRLEAEVIRDATLAVSGLMDRTMYGPPEPLRQGSDGQWVIDPARGQPARRSLYVLHRRSGLHGFLQAFDAPAMDNGNMPLRFRSALPTQSLALMNSRFVNRAAEAFARRVLHEARGQTREAVERAFLLAYARPMRPEESDVIVPTLEATADADSALKLICHALLASNEFLYSF